MARTSKVMCYRFQVAVIKDRGGMLEVADWGQVAQAKSYVAGEKVSSGR